MTEYTVRYIDMRGMLRDRVVSAPRAGRAIHVVAGCYIHDDRSVPVSVLSVRNMKTGTMEYVNPNFLEKIDECCNTID